MQFQFYLYIQKSSGKWKGEWTGWNPSGPILTSLYFEVWRPKSSGNWKGGWTWMGMQVQSPKRLHDSNNYKFSKNS